MSSQIERKHAAPETNTDPLETVHAYLTSRIEEMKQQIPDTASKEPIDTQSPARRWITRKIRRDPGKTASLIDRIAAYQTAADVLQLGEQQRAEGILIEEAVSLWTDATNPFFPEIYSASRFQEAARRIDLLSSLNPQRGARLEDELANLQR